MRTIVYIDGFNLYYGALKVRWPNLKWLDLRALCVSLLSGRQIVRIRYFTALVKPPPHDPKTRERQEIYLRALRTIPQIEIHFGWFVQREGLRYQLPLAYPNNRPNGPPQSVRVQLPEEKGSDVNLASYLLLDCFKKACDEAVVISNDADLKTPIEIATREFGNTVGVINPHPKSWRSVDLAGVASWSYQTINRTHLARSQFPLTLTDARGTITKPAAW
mgnify:CR=1 FL=1